MRHTCFPNVLPGMIVCLLSVSFQAIGLAQESTNQLSEKELKERFGEQQFSPKGGFLFNIGQTLPELVWENPDLVATVLEKPGIPTRWFDKDFKEVKIAEKSGRYYAYGEAPAPTGSVLRQAMTCCCVGQEFNLRSFAEKRTTARKPDLDLEDKQTEIDTLLHHWKTTESGAVELAALLETKQLTGPVREGQWEMENATQHVRLKRKLMGLDQRPLLKATAKKLQGKPAPTLRKAPLEQTGISPAQVRELESRLEAMYASTSEPMGVVLAHKGVIIFSQGYGELDGKPVTVDTPMRLDSAMKPLIGLQLAMYVDQGFLKLDEPIGNYLPDFKTPQDKQLTFRAGHVHATGIHFPWDLAFSRLFYFHTWHESLIAHCKREWQPGARHRYGVVGVILSVRALELLRGRNYWDAMERDLFKPLGIRHVLPGGRGFSAESMARIGVLLDNRGKYGEWELFSEETHQAILPTSLKPYFPKLDMNYGIGLKGASQHLGKGSYGHGGGCGTVLAVNPQTHLVFAMVRNSQGKGYKEHRSRVMDLIKQWYNE